MNDSDLVWRTEDITAAIKVFAPHPEASAAFNSGQVLELEQRLNPREYGWTNMKIDIPEHWEVLSVSVENEGVVLKLEDGTTFNLNPHNQGDLNFEILDGAVTKPDSVLEKIWIRHALKPQD